MSLVQVSTDFVGTVAWLRTAYVFFFKQKTAYEMRISDCSSDVCSSDLHGGGRGRIARSAATSGHLQLAGHRAGGFRSRPAASDPSPGGCRARDSQSSQATR